MKCVAVKKNANSHVMFLITVLYLLLLQTMTMAQFFTKTTNSIPRMGRRSELAAPSSSLQQKRLNRSLRYLMAMVEGYDSDRNGHLSAEELLNIPLVQYLVESALSAYPPKGGKKFKVPWISQFSNSEDSTDWEKRFAYQ